MTTGRSPQIEAVVESFESEFFAREQEAFEETVRVLFRETPGLHRLLIQGSTPSFADGDLCEHSQYTYVRNRWGDLPDLDANEVSDHTTDLSNGRCLLQRSRWQSFANGDEDSLGVVFEGGERAVIRHENQNVICVEVR